MKKFPQNLNGDDLELILFENIRQRKRKNRLFKIPHLLQQIVFSLKQEPKPKIGQVKNHLGQTIWCVYDPITGQSARLSSEVEVRLWLEARYYQVQEQNAGMKTQD